EQREEVSPVPSSYSADSGGALAAYQMLASLHYPVGRWEDSPTELPTGTGSLLILAEPTVKPTPRERAALLEYVQRGGRRLFLRRLDSFVLRSGIRLQRLQCQNA